MKRKLTFICVLGAAIVLGILAFVFIKSNTTSHFKDLYVSEEAWKIIISNRLPKNDLEVGAIYFDDVLLQEDKNGQRLFYSVDTTNKVSPNPKMVTSDNNIHFASLESELDLGAISENKTISMLAYNDEYYRQIELVLTTLPILNIDMLSEGEINDDDSDVILTLNDHGQITKSNSKIHTRGGYTKFRPKKAYKLSLKKENGKKNKMSLLGMRKDDDWIINALYTDWEKVREIFATDLWRECCAEHNYAGVNNSFEYRYVEVFMNNSYHGLYLLGYKPDKKVTEIKDGEIMFKNQSYSDVSDLRKNPHNDYYTVENDVDSVTAAKQELISFLEVLESGNPEEIRDKFDIQNAIDYDLFIYLTTQTDVAVDGKTKNLYITIKEVNGKRFAMYTPWDFDFCFHMIPEIKNTGIDPSSYVSGYRAMPKPNTFPAWILKHRGDKKIEAEENARYAELRVNAWSNYNIMRLLNGYEQKIFNSGAYRRDVARWPDSEYMAGLSDLSLFKEYITNRLDYLDEYYGFSPEE